MGKVRKVNNDKTKRRREADMGALSRTRPAEVVPYVRAGFEGREHAKATVTAGRADVKKSVCAQ